MEKEEKKGIKINKVKFVRNIIISLIALGLVAGIFVIAPNYTKPEDDGRTQLIINNTNLTTSNRLSNDVLIENGVIYLSKEDVSRFFDNYLYYESKYNQYITTTDTKVATIEVGTYKMDVNGISFPISGTIIERNGSMYLPFSEMKDVYNVEIQNIDENNIVLVDSISREQVKANVKKNVSVKLKKRTLSRTVDRVKKGETVVVISKTDDGWAKVRTKGGRIGYIQTEKLENEKVVRENRVEEKQIANEKISIIWDYYNESKSAPDRSGTKIKGINVVSPSFFSLKTLGKGEIIDKVGSAGKEYIKWAKGNNYKVWAMFASDSKIETTSEILNDYKLRQQTIEKIVDLAVKYGLDGINLDFENIYKEDKNMFTRFVVELYPRLKDVGMTLTVDVTAPDGGETWSLCYDRDALADNCDYLVYMAYDQNNASSVKAGPVAGYNWVRTNVDKFLGQEDVDAEKLILAIPFYTRLWTENAEGKLVDSDIVNMKDVNNVIKNNATKQWNETTRQNYIEYKQGNKTYKMWIEDMASIKEKLLLVNEKNLAGVAFWAKDRESKEVWDLVDQIIFNNK